MRANNISKTKKKLQDISQSTKQPLQEETKLNGSKLYSSLILKKDDKMQQKKIDEIKNSNLTDSYFTNVYGPLINKVSSIKQLRDLTQRQQAFDEGHFSIGCPCFNCNPFQSKKKLFANMSWFNGKNNPKDDREMIPINLDCLSAPMLEDIEIDEGIIFGLVGEIQQKKKKKINMLRQRFNEVLLDGGYQDEVKQYRLMGNINKSIKGKLDRISYFEIESGDMIKFEFENKGILTGKQENMKVDYKEMSSFYMQLIITDIDNVQDTLEISQKQSNSDKLIGAIEFLRRKQSHFSLQLVSKQRQQQYSYDAIDQMRQLKQNDPAKLLRILTTFDTVYCESIISLCIIIRDIPLLKFLFEEILSDQNFTGQEEYFYKFVSVEIMKGFQKVSMKFKKDTNFFLELQKRIIDEKEIKASQFYQILKQENNVNIIEDNKIISNEEEGKSNEEKQSKRIRKPRKEFELEEGSSNQIQFRNQIKSFSYMTQFCNYQFIKKFINLLYSNFMVLYFSNQKIFLLYFENPNSQKFSHKICELQIIYDKQNQVYSFIHYGFYFKIM